MTGYIASRRKLKKKVKNKNKKKSSTKKTKRVSKNLKYNLNMSRSIAYMNAHDMAYWVRGLKATRNYGT